MCQLILIGLGLTLPLAYTIGPKFVSYYIKLSLFYISLLVVSSLVTPLLLFKPRNVENMILPARMMQRVSNWLGLLWTVVDVHKLEALAGQTAVIVCNHQYSFDLFPLFVLWPICKKLTVVAKESLKYLGSFGIVAVKCCIVFINRKKGKESREVIQSSLMDCKADGTKLLVFPEGTRNHNVAKKDMLKFKTGAFLAAVGAQVPIVPIVISHYDFLNPAEKNLEPAAIEIRVLDPVPTAGLTEADVATLVDSVRSRMLQVFAGNELDSEPVEDAPELTQKSSRLKKTVSEKSD